MPGIPQTRSAQPEEPHRGFDVRGEPSRYRDRETLQPRENSMSGLALRQRQRQWPSPLTDALAG